MSKFIQVNLILENVVRRYCMFHKITTQVLSVMHA